MNPTAGCNVVQEVVMQFADALAEAGTLLIVSDHRGRTEALSPPIPNVQPLNSQELAMHS